MKSYEIIIECFKNNPNRVYTARELAELMATTFPDELEKKISRTTVSTKEKCIKQWYDEICAHAPQWEKYNIFITSDVPKKYYYVDKNISSKTDKVNKKNNQPEAELYPVLIEFCKSEGINALRIDEKKSKKNKGQNYNKWLHPDIVGFKDLTINYEKEVKDCIVQCAGERSYLYAFEVKDEIIQPSEL